MDYLRQNVSYPPRSTHGLPSTFYHPNLLQNGNNYRKKPGCNDPDDDYISDDGDADEYDEEEEEEDEDEDEEQEEDEEDEEDEIDDEDGEEEEERDHKADPPQRELNSSFCPPSVQIRSSTDIYGASASATLLGSRTSNIPAPVKAVEQEKHYRDDWNDAATLALLQVWGTKYLQLGRKSLKLEDWTEVAGQVTLLGKIFKTDIQCRNRIDTLKKKYKREKQKQAAIGSSISKWVYYKHMDALLNTVSQRTGLPCAVDAGQIIRTNPQLRKSRNQNKHSAYDFSAGGDLKENPKLSESFFNMSDEEFDGETNQISRKRKLREAPFRSLAKAIKKFSKIYEKMETNKQQQLLDLERTRMQLTREFELQKMQLLMQTQMELANLKQGGNDMDASVSNMSG